MQASWVLPIREYCKHGRGSALLQQWGGLPKENAGRVLRGRTRDACRPPFRYGDNGGRPILNSHGRRHPEALTVDRRQTGAPGAEFVACDLDRRSTRRAADHQPADFQLHQAVAIQSGGPGDRQADTLADPERMLGREMDLPAADLYRLAAPRGDQASALQTLIAHILLNREEMLLWPWICPWPGPAPLYASRRCFPEARASNHADSLF